MTRFAPAPTGFLHLGHVVNAIYVWGIARARGGRVILRIEDHDRRRCRPEYESALLEDLDWLGFEPDLGRTAEFRQGACQFRQSNRGAIYLAAIAELSVRQRIYACDCSRKQLAATASAASGEVRYSGRCRERGLEPGPGRGLRVVLPDVEERFTDVLVGPQKQHPSAQCGDLLLRDRLGNWTYQFAVTVDDLRQSVTLVIRGRDLLESTGRQVLLAKMLGRGEPPVYLHHSLVYKPSGAKLSKASGDTSIRHLREHGITAAEILGRAAWSVGLTATDAPLDGRDLPELFVS